MKLLVEHTGPPAPLDFWRSGHHFILTPDGNVRVAGLFEWAHWLQNHDEDRKIAKDGNRFYIVTTIFLGLNHRYFEDGPPLLFESMVFRSDGEGNFARPMNELDMARYSTREEALEGHAELCKKWLDGSLHGEIVDEDRLGDVHGREDS